MAEDGKIALGGLPLGSPGAYDTLIGVDQATGAGRRYPFPILDGMRGYATRADLFADLSAPAGTLARVTNDPTSDYNGTYRKAGSPGTGNWTKAIDRVDTLEAQSGASGFLTAGEPNINLDLAGGFLRIPTAGTVRVTYGRATRTLPAQDVAIPTTGTAYSILLNPATGLLSFQAPNIAVPATYVVVGTYYVPSKTVFGFPPHYLNGAPYPKRQSWGVATNVPALINVNTTLGQVEMAAGVRLVSAVGSYLLPAATVSIPSGNTFYRLDYDPRNNSVGVASGSSADEFKVPFAVVQRNGSALTLTQVDNFTVDGVVVDRNPPTRGEITAALDGAGLDFDFNAGLLRIAAGTTRFTRADKTTVLPAQDVALPAASGAWSRIVVNNISLAVSFKATSAVLDANEVAVGLVNTFYKRVSGVAAHYVNGQPVASEAADLTTVEHVLVNGTTEADYELPAPLPEYASFLATATHTDVYALYDALMAAHPGYITRTSLGLDDVGNTIYRYDFSPPPVATVGLPHSEKFAKIILFSGVHGAEKAGIYTLYLALKQVAEAWESDARLETLRWNVHFIVVPVAVPFGFDNNTRHNENGVDIARNFPADWVAREPGHEQYGGTAPLTEKSAQYLDALMAANRDAIYLGTFHNFFTGADILWNAGSTRFGVALAKSWISRMSRIWKARYAWLPQDETSYVGYASITAPPGSEGKQATMIYGIQAGTIEVNRQIEAAPDPSPYGSIAATLGTEAFINWLLMNLEFGAKLYNGRL